MSIIYTTQFKKDVKRITRRQWDVQTFLHIVDKLHKRERLEAKHTDHKLTGNLKESRECHIKSDWLLIYWLKGQDLILERTGSHSDLYKK